MRSGEAMMQRKVWGWALYYWGTHAFTPSIITVFFPIFFKDYWSSGADVTVSTFRLGLANSVASLIVALSAPLLGAIADRGGHGKKFLLASALLGSIMVLALHWVPQGAWQWAALFYVLASIGYFWGNVFGDSMLVAVAGPRKLDIPSAIGYFAGYPGGGLFLAPGVAMSLKPESLCLAGPAWAGGRLPTLPAALAAAFAPRSSTGASASASAGAAPASSA